MLRIFVLGGTRLVFGEEDEDVWAGATSGPERRLLAFLALNRGRSFTKDDAADRIWGFGGKDSLRKALDQLRATLASVEGLEASRCLAETPGDRGRKGQIGIKEGGVWVDALAFRDLSETEPAAALALYDGDLLASDTNVGPWLEAERARLRRRAAAAMGNLAEIERRAGRTQEAVRWASRRFQIEGKNAEAAAALARLQALDDRHSALETVEAALEADSIDESDRESLTTLADEINRREVRRPPSSDSAQLVLDEPAQRAPGPGKPASRASRSHKAPILLLLIAAAAVVGGLAVGAAALTGDDEEAKSPGAETQCDPTALTEPSPSDLAARRVPPPQGGTPQQGSLIVTRSRPRSIVAASDGIWLTQSVDGSVWRINPEMGKPVGEPWPVGDVPYALAVARKAIWVTRDDGVLVQLDRRSGDVEQRVKLGPVSGEVAIGAGSVWVNIFDGKNRGSVARIDPCTGAVEYIPVGTSANTVLFAFDAVWVTDSQERSLHRIDPESGTVQDVPLDVTDPQDLGAGGGFIWIAHYGPKLLTRVDPQGLKRVGKPIKIGAGPAGIEVGAGKVWLPNYEGDSLTTVDLKTFESDPNAVPVGDSPTDLAIGRGRIWVTNNDAEPPTVSVVKP